MTTSRLPDDEQRILDEMERVLRRDRRLDRRMRRLRPRRPSVLSRAAAFRPPVWIVALLLAVAIGLMVTGIRTSAPAVIWAFAAVWPLALFAVFRLLSRWRER